MGNKSVAWAMGVTAIAVIICLAVVPMDSSRLAGVAFLMAAGVMLAAFWIHYQATWSLRDQDKIANLTAKVAEQSRNITTLFRERDSSSMALSSAQSKLRFQESIVTTLTAESNNQRIIIRRLNGILKDHDIDATAANVPPASADGDALASNRAARGNPVPPPPLPDNLRDQVVSRRASMAQPHAPSAPVTTPSDSGMGLTAGLLAMHAVSDTPSTPTRSEPTCSARDSGSDSSSYSSDSGGSSGCD